MGETDFAFELGLEDSLRAGPVKIPVEKQLGLGNSGLVFRVETGVSSDQINVPVAIQVTGSQAAPPTGHFFHTRPGRNPAQATLNISDDLHRPPFSGHDKFRPGITIGIRPDGGCNHPQLPKPSPRRNITESHAAVAGVVAEQATARCLGIFAGNNAAADENVKIPILVIISHRSRATTYRNTRQCIIWGR